MFCSRCGQPVNNQPYCPQCGAPTGLAAMPGGSAIPPPNMYGASRVQRHLRTLGILWVVYACYQAAVWLLLLHFAFHGGSPWMRGTEPWMYGFHPGGWLIHFIAIMVFARVILSLAAGVGLLTRQPWGRVFAIVIAFLTLIKPLLGTALAIYTLWVLLCRNAGQEYDTLSMSREVRPL